MRLNRLIPSLVVPSVLAFFFALPAPLGLAAEVERKAEEKDPKKDETKDTLFVTDHTARIGGKEIKYTATAGKLVMKDDVGKPKAEVFFVAYTKRGVEDLSQRPVTFAFNGGPGSSSVWLHLGMLGPRRVKLPDDATQSPAPYSLEDNPHSILDITDLVFIDPVSTGFSRPAKGENDDQFHGYEEDLRSVGQFIHDYVTKYDRWRGPKFLIGESYGGFRSAGLSGHLRDRYNMSLDGILMISPALNFETLGFAFGNDLPFVLFVPSYAATAWYHKALPGDLQSLSLEEVFKQATDFALNEYTLALMKGHSMSRDEENAVAEKLARYTGLSKQYVLRANLRIGMQRFAKELLRGRGKMVGRFDSRYQGIDADDAGESPEYDASAAAFFGPFTAGINDYLHNDLKVEDERVYEIISDKVGPWSYGRYTTRFPDATDTLRESLSANPHLKLFVASGYYDLATPPTSVTYSLNHMRLPNELHKNIEQHHYEGGHMMYVHEPSMKKLRQDVAAFYEKTLHRGE
ncbi:MAG: peptidase S10 [Pirellulales bacterium]|nr:peptidase S10 [Pirellulales bacterium]